RRKASLVSVRNAGAGGPAGIETQRPTQFQWRRSPRLRDDICLGEKAPHVDDRFAGKIEVAISGMRRAQDEEIAAAYHLLQTEEVRIGGHEWIGGEHCLGEARERLLEFVAQRGASVVDVRLERHA